MDIEEVPFLSIITSALHYMFPDLFGKHSVRASFLKASVLCICLLCIIGSIFLHSTLIISSTNSTVVDTYHNDKSTNIPDVTNERSTTELVAALCLLIPLLIFKFGLRPVILSISSIPATFLFYKFITLVVWINDWYNITYPKRGVISLEERTFIDYLVALSLSFLLIIFVLGPKKTLQSTSLVVLLLFLFNFTTKQTDITSITPHIQLQRPYDDIYNQFTTPTNITRAQDDRMDDLLPYRNYFVSKMCQILYTWIVMTSSKWTKSMCRIKRWTE